MAVLAVHCPNWLRRHGCLGKRICLAYAVVVSTMTNLWACPSSMPRRRQLDVVHGSSMRGYPDTSISGEDVGKSRLLSMSSE